MDQHRHLAVRIEGNQRRRMLLELQKVDVMRGELDALFLKAHHHLCNGREIRSPLSFLFVTLRNLVNDAHRRGAGAPAETPLISEETVPRDEAPSVERQVVSEREFEALCAAIAQLPERMRYAFVLRKVYGYSCREIARHLGRSTNTVRQQVAQSFRKLEAIQRGDRTTGAGHRRTDAPEQDALRIFNVPLPSRE